MTDPSPVESAHRRFSAECFNATWNLLDKTDRAPAEDVALVAVAQASLWHWMQRPDCTDKNLSIAYWLLSRVYSVTQNGGEARRYAELSLELARRPGVAPFALAFAHEAVARSASLQGDADAVARHLADARALSEGLDAETSKRLLADLDGIAPP
jgi:hypothetical protein